MEECKTSRLARADILVAVALLFLSTLIVPNVILRSRERARRSRCADNLRIISLALNNYMVINGTLPYAARWTSEGMNLERVDSEPWIGRATRENWAQLILPLMGEQRLADSFVHSAPMTGPENAAARNVGLGPMKCPSDPYNQAKNPYTYADPVSGTKASFARGNFAINGGSNDASRFPGSSSAPAAGGYRYDFDPATGKFAWWGNGVAGINKALGPGDFRNGLATLVAVDEVRAGINPVDPRGVWALGHIGGSITFAHGMTGDDGSPNNQGERADDIVGCNKLYKTIGAEKLSREGMPCCSYWPNSHQATARSLHPGGVNALMMDGAVRFVSDSIDPGLWHGLHSRETAPDLFDLASFGQTPGETETGETLSADGASPSGSHVPGPSSPGKIVNSIGMELVLIPPGEFRMGVPDVGYDNAVPPESPPHRVRITRPYYIGACEVTQEQYERVMGRNPSWHTTSSGLSGRPGQTTATLPVEQVSWEDAAEFCRRLSRLSAEAEVGLVYRLPTEAEWEYACRSGRSDPYRWGGEPDPKSGENAGEQQAGSLDVVSVGSYPPNGFDVHDMRGNVYEWCSDWFARDYYSRSPVDDPQGPASGFLRVVRGGDWLYVGEGCMINRRVTAPWQSCPFIGFRIAATAGLGGRPAPLETPQEMTPTLAVYSSHRNPKQVELIKFEPLRRTASFLKSGWLHAPSWSHDGRRIAFAEDKVDIKVVDADGTNLRNLTRGRFRFATAPSWSPDDARIVFFGSQDDANGVRSVFVMDADGGNIKAILQSKQQQLFPAWSPDGSRILFQLEREGAPGTFDFATTAPDGSGLEIVRKNVPYLSAPAWRPDGRRFAFADFGEGPGQLRLRVASADGGAITSEIAGGGYDLFPAWSPDGRRIAYAHFEGDKDVRGDLMIFDVDRGTSAVVSEGTLVPGEEARPTWAPTHTNGARRAGVDPTAGATPAISASSVVPGN